MASRQIQDAVSWRLVMITDAIKQLPQDLLARYPHVDWEQAVSMRNFLVHDYLEIDLEIVWDTVAENLPLARTALAEMLAGLETDGGGK